MVNATGLGPTWMISATFVGGGTFHETFPSIATSLLNDTLALTGVLTGTVSPPKGNLPPTQLLNSQVKASVLFHPMADPLGGLAQRTIL
jgi:hypothetical protein